MLTLDDIIHPEVRKLHPGTDVPEFAFDTSHAGFLILGYHSSRKLCAFAEGLVPGSGLRGAFAFPLLVGDETLGVLELFTEEPAERDDDVLALCNAVGATLGRVVERVRAADADTYIEHVVDGAARLQQLIDDLLTYSHSTQPLRVEPVELGLVVGRHAARARGDRRAALR